MLNPGQKTPFDEHGEQVLQIGIRDDSKENIIQHWPEVFRWTGCAATEQPQ